MIWLLEKVKEHNNTNEGFNAFWKEKEIIPAVNEAVEPYKNNLPSVPHVCLKVPTAGGKTFIACNALRTIFSAFPTDAPKMVVWLVPSNAILEQTVRSLSDSSHPYRQKIDAHFQHRVAVFEKPSLLQGTGFSASSVQEQLSILVLSFDSLRAKNKEDRKVYQENGNLQSFGRLLSEEEISLMKVINSLKPVVIVDESHNAETELSVEMLKNLNPSFVLDLTATPRKNSNIISFVNSLELKKANMVKLPVIVSNFDNKNEVIINAIDLRNNLEKATQAEYTATGKYIRPILLFQAQSKNNKEDTTTFQKLKEKLVKDLQIPENQVKIKTADLNELKNVDLLSPTCEVRYIITINALKEGWDCPFAYILASLADKSSVVDVTQILGRVLRLPYTSPYKEIALNLSYVLTASSKFQETLQKVVEGLKVAGFSEKDKRVVETPEIQPTPTVEQAVAMQLFGTEEQVIETPIDDIDTEKIRQALANNAESTQASSFVQQVMANAAEASTATNLAISNSENSLTTAIPPELKTMQKRYAIKTVFEAQAKAMQLPQFFIKVEKGEIFNTETQEVLISRENLLKDFKLSKCDINISFENIASDMYKVDLDGTQRDFTPTFTKLDSLTKEYLQKYYVNPSRKEDRTKRIVKDIMEHIGNMYPISDSEIQKYINRILEDFKDEQFEDFVNRKNVYCYKIKQKINHLADKYAEEVFKKGLDTESIFINDSYTFPHSIPLTETAKDLPKSLYEKEGKINSFEEKVINEIANLENIVFWTRNDSKKSFCINGFINHYPDFVILTKKGKIVVLETKGDHLYAENKISLGSLWASKSGKEYRYYLVYEDRKVEGAFTLDGFLENIRNL